jgi:glycosyltransferase involved in cell wall biosynthesis
MKIVNARRPARLIVIGEGPLRAELVAEAAELGIGERVDLPGFQPNPYPFLSAASAFALSSAYEGLPHVLVEALACGAPSVSTDCRSGAAEVLDGGLYGLLVPVGNADALAEAILRLLSDGRLAGQLRQAGPIRAQAFSMEAAADRFLACLRNAGVDLLPPSPALPEAGGESVPAR